ncbi:MAG TPA: histidine phosphatase family protein [Candidatus Saccharimonadales bacterium]|nr:histidine phosphatase family protein [Candidatus Saccharimonadales bacterium]
MLKIYIARHGQDKDNAAGILNGRRDQPLTDIGLKQAQDLTRTIWSNNLHFDAVYCSPLQRAYRTAEIITDTLELPKPVVREGLIERDFGVMTGVAQSKIEALCAPDIIKSETITYFLNPEGAETFPELLGRARRILAEVQSDHTDGSVLLVTHGDFGKMLFAAYYELEWQPVLSMFHFGNSELLELSKDTTPIDAHIYQTTQFNT